MRLKSKHFFNHLNLGFLEFFLVKYFIIIWKGDYRTKWIKTNLYCRWKIVRNDWYSVFSIKLPWYNSFIRLISSCYNSCISFCFWPYCTLAIGNCTSIFFKLMIKFCIWNSKKYELEFISPLKKLDKSYLVTFLIKSNKS